MKNVGGVTEASVNLATENVALLIDPNRTDFSKFSTAVKEAGYKFLVPEEGLPL